MAVRLGVPIESLTALSAKVHRTVGGKSQDLIGRFGPTPGIFVVRASPRANVSDVRVWDITGNAEAYLRSHAHRMYALLAVHSPP